jgi:hypothetical protein
MEKITGTSVHPIHLQLIRTDQVPPSVKTKNQKVPKGEDWVAMIPALWEWQKV